MIRPMRNAARKAITLTPRRETIQFHIMPDPDSTSALRRSGGKQLSPRFRLIIGGSYRLRPGRVDNPFIDGVR
jgi:hypothetical protein